jgi:hypothetical protein
MLIENEGTLPERFFEPLQNALRESKSTRKCKGYSDADHLKSGVRRALENVVSGREWVQYLQLVLSMGVSVRNFFSSLSSKRRLEVTTEINEHVRSQTDELLIPQGDPFSKYPELNQFAIYASDGHTHQASSHEKCIEEKKRPVTHLYTLNLRSHSLAYLDLCIPKKGKKKEHEISTLKGLGGQKLRMGESTGTKVIHAYDPAIVDYKQWQKWKKSSGVYIVTLEKKNSAFEFLSFDNVIDDDPINKGVLSDEKVIALGEVVIRRIKYKEPVSGKIYSFLTTEMTLPPGLIVFIYKMRWNIEKVFDQIKNKMMERKAWANSIEAKKQQAAFICLAYNLMLILQFHLELEEGILDEKSIEKRKKRLQEDSESATKNGREMNILVLTYSRPSQCCCQFIRWLKACIQNSTPWRQAVTLLRPLMLRYLN